MPTLLKAITVALFTRSSTKATVSLFAFVSGLLSPVTAAVLKEAVSEIISPSNPNFSPDFNCMIPPMFAASALIVLGWLFSKIDQWQMPQ